MAAPDPLQPVLAVLAKMAAKLAAVRPAPPPVPVPERKAKPPGPAPQPPPRGIVWDKRVGWHVPCGLTAEQLEQSEPSAEFVRRIERLAAASTLSTPSSTFAPTLAPCRQSYRTRGGDPWR